MIGSFLTRGLVLIFGYAYPAYECFKTVERNKPEIEHLRFWCQYWILVALLTVCERVGDTFVSWVPMYSEAKLAFFIYLWYPKTKGTTYVYDSFFRPYIAKHETEIDRNIMELRTRAGDIVVLYWQKAATYGQTRFFDILQYVAAQSTPRPRAAQPPQQQGGGAARVARQPSIGVQNRKAVKVTAPVIEEPPSPVSSTSSSDHQEDIAKELGPSVIARSTSSSAAAAVVVPKTQKVSAAVQPPTAVETSNHNRSNSNDNTVAAAVAMQIDTASSSTNIENANTKAQEDATTTVMEEAIRFTRGRLRKSSRTATTTTKP